MKTLPIFFMCLLAGLAHANDLIHPHPFGKPGHEVIHTDGETEAKHLPADLQWISKDWQGENGQMPYLAFSAEQQRVLLMMECGKPIHTALQESTDGGATWGPRRWLHVDATGAPDGVALGLTDLGGGHLLAWPEDMAVEWRSEDFGRTWSQRKPDFAGEHYTWDPALVLPGGKQLAQGFWRTTGVPWGSDAGPYSHAYLRTSADSGMSWTEPVKVPQWLGINEVQILRAQNGDWVAACRTDNPKRFAKTQFDHYSGLGVCISKDEGKTWSDLNLLHEVGRHHPSMLLLPDGRILMTYVVRLGYPDAADGYPQFGVEAVLSTDNGATWDLAHRYILARWTGNILGPNAWYCGVQSTSTLRLPDGQLLTAVGAGFRNTASSTTCVMDIALLRWRLE